MFDDHLKSTTKKCCDFKIIWRFTTNCAIVGERFYGICELANNVLCYDNFAFYWRHVDILYCDCWNAMDEKDNERNVQALSVVDEAWTNVCV